MSHLPSNVTSTAGLSTRVSVWFRSFPLMTRVIIVTCALLQLSGYIFGTYNGRVCVHPPSVLHKYEVWRLITAAYYHSGILHILLNMMALTGIGPSIERSLGSLSFIYNIFLFGFLGSTLYVLIAALLFYNPIIQYPDFMGECAVGFSGVLFALMVINTHAGEGSSRSIFGFFSVPTQYYPWVLLIVLQFIMPGVSFLGHLSGIILGYLYVYGYLSYVQLSASMMNSLEGSRMLSWLVAKDGYIANPHLGSNPLSSANSRQSTNGGGLLSSVLPTIRPSAPSSPSSPSSSSPSSSPRNGSSSFSGTGYVLGSKPSESGTFAQLPPKS